jgi:hypothetical protein
MDTRLKARWPRDRLARPAHPLAAVSALICRAAWPATHMLRDPHTPAGPRRPKSCQSYCNRRPHRRTRSPSPRPAPCRVTASSGSHAGSRHAVRLYQHKRSVNLRYMYCTSYIVRLRMAVTLTYECRQAALYPRDKRYSTCRQTRDRRVQRAAQTDEASSLSHRERPARAQARHVDGRGKSSPWRCSSTPSS